MTITEKIKILAGTIRSRAREIGYNTKNITERQAADFAEMQVHEAPNTIAAQFYMESTDKQWKKVYKEVIK